MNTGIEFGPFSMGETISSSMSATITTDTKSSYSYNFEETYTVNCEDLPEGESGVGLWQFMVYTNDGSGSVATNHFICRYGDLYNKAPQCPWTACSAD